MVERARLMRRLAAEVRAQMKRSGVKSVTALDRMSGVSRQTIDNTLKQRHLPDFDTLFRLARAMNCTLEITLTPKDNDQ